MPGNPTNESASSLCLDYRPPFDFASLAAFLACRAIPGVEHVEANTYTRSVTAGTKRGAIRVRADAARDRIECIAIPPLAALPDDAPRRLAHLFDLDAEPADIHRVLRSDPRLAPIVHARPGLRLPGAWDPFEVAVRAVVGQQISVKAASTVMGVIAQRYGENSGSARCFPGAECLASADPADLPMPATRAAAVIGLSRAVAEGLIRFDGVEPQRLAEALRSIRGIGPWTAEYTAMRAGRDRDAFPSGDLVLKRVAARHLGIADERALLARAERWRPWRAYAALYLWALAAPEGKRDIDTGRTGRQSDRPTGQGAKPT